VNVVNLDVTSQAGQLTLPPARPTNGIYRLLGPACRLLYYGAARHLPYSALPHAAWARHVRYHVCRGMLRRCGRNVNVEHGAFINSGREVDIGDNSGIGLDAHIVGPVVIGRNVMMGPRCMLLAINHETGRTDRPMIDQGVKKTTPPIIEDDVWLGAGVTVLPGRRIGTGSIIGAGSVVATDIPPFTIAAGNPAIPIGHRNGTSSQ
jgi:maltose O-acetyltransferase